VNSRLLSWAVEEAYHGLLMTGKHPVAVVNIDLPAAELDVNIHPAKSEVKFRDEHAVSPRCSGRCGGRWWRKPR